MHPDTSIRLALAQSPGVDRDSLEMLVTDLDIHVSLAAQRALDALDDEDHDNDPGAPGPARRSAPAAHRDDVPSRADPAPDNGVAVLTDWLTEEG